MLAKGSDPLLREMIGLYVVCIISIEKAEAGMCLGACMSDATLPDYADRFALCLIQGIV